VLAEETFSGARFVAWTHRWSEQLKVSGFTVESRYSVTCNGRMVPLQLTGEPGIALAGCAFVRGGCRHLCTPRFPFMRPLSSTLSTA